MKITRDIVLDLLPLYLSGEASADSRALIVEYLAQDLELAQRIRAQPEDLFKDAMPTPLPPDLEVRALRRARTLINLQKWLFGLGIASTAISLAIEVNFNHGHIPEVHFLIGYYPLQIGAVALMAVACWICYYYVRRQLR